MVTVFHTDQRAYAEQRLPSAMNSGNWFTLGSNCAQVPLLLPPALPPPPPFLFLNCPPPPSSSLSHVADHASTVARVLCRRKGVQYASCSVQCDVSGEGGGLFDASGKGAFSGSQ